MNELADRTHPYHTAPRGVWLATGTPTSEPYPCRCADRCRRNRCPCSGRTDLDGLPAGCCAMRATNQAALADLLAAHGGAR